MFASISQGAIRKVARETFEHLLNMDMKFHLERQTGGLTRAIDRGTKSVSFKGTLNPNTDDKAFLKLTIDSEESRLSYLVLSFMSSQPLLR